MEQLTQDVATVVGALGIDKVHYMGLSIGGMIGQMLALRQTGKFEKMVLADTGHMQPPEAIKQWEERIKIATSQGMKALVPSTMERWFTAPFRESAPAKKIAGIIAATPVNGYVGCGQAIMKLNTTARLKEIKVPVLAITGESDPSAGATKYIGENVPGAKLVIIPQAAHIANVEQPAKFNQALREFL